MHPIRVGLIGDFSPKYHTHVAMPVALQHIAEIHELEIEPEWIPTPRLIEPDTEAFLGNFHALWAAPASPYDSMPGMLRGIEYARTRKVPFTGT